MTNKENPNFDVLNAISILAKKLEKSHLKIKRTNEFNNAEEKLNKYFDTTSGGTWMLCGILSFYFEHHGSTCNFNDLADFFDCPVMSTIAFKKDIENLLAKRFITNKIGERLPKVFRSHMFLNVLASLLVILLVSYVWTVVA